MPRAIVAAITAVCVALAIACAASLARVAELEARELDAAGEWHEPTVGSRTLGLLATTLLRHDEATFELCSRDAMDPADWSSLRARVSRTEPSPEEIFAVRLDQRVLARAARGTEGSCVSFAHVDALAIDEASIGVEIDLETVGPWPPGLTVRARVLARRRLSDLDLLLVLAALASALALVGALALRRPTRAGWLPPPASRAVVGLVVLVGAAAALSRLAPSGPTWGLGTGVLLAAIELSAAIVLARQSTTSATLAALGLERPPSRVLAIGGFAFAPIAAVLLFFAARVALRSVPSTGQAPVEAFVSWPSGMLSFAVLAVIAPIAEEVFFRGLVYGALRGDGGVRREVIAAVGAWLLFAIAHLPQDWGNWGGMTSVLMAGLGFTLLRAGSKSTLVPCVAHLLYNGMLAASALVAGAG